MNLRENIERMMQIAYKADKNFNEAKTEFATAVSNQQIELIGLANLIKVGDCSKIVNTFNRDYLDLFRSKFCIIDNLLDSVIHSGAVSEEAFASTGLDAIGINNTNMRSEFVSTGMMWPIIGESISITTLDKKSMPFDLWPEVYKTKACNEDNLLFLKHTDGYIYPIYSNSFADHLLVDLIIGTSIPDLRHPVAKLEYTSPPDHVEVYYYKGHEPPITYDNCNVVYQNNLVMTECLSRETWDPIIVGPFYKCNANFGETLFDFTNLLKGNFGNTPSTSGLDNQLAFRLGKPSDESEAESTLTWFSKEAEEYKSVDPILTHITTPRALEQATALYAAKYAVLRIMYGHLCRLILGK